MPFVKFLGSKLALVNREFFVLKICLREMLNVLLIFVARLSQRILVSIWVSPLFIVESGPKLILR